MQVNATLGTDMEYIFSHSTMAGSAGYYEDPWAANQVNSSVPANATPLIPALELVLLSYCTCAAGKVGLRALRQHWGLN